MRKRLTLVVHKELRDLVRQLPREVRVHADALPVHLAMTPRPFELKEGVEPDTLGLFIGDSFADSSDSCNVEPPQIILFIENIWDYARHDSGDFRTEIKRTYLHELGHYLGLEEDDLTLRGLD